MKERPILFSAPMVRAILEGRKTQTRRVVKPQPSTDRSGVPWPAFKGGAVERACPYGVPGDRLWVRETWRVTGVSDLPVREMSRFYRDSVQYRADRDESYIDRYRNPRYMPRWASRITLEVTGVRVERVQDISDNDARDEGVTPRYYNSRTDHRDAYMDLWESLNAKREPWASNPWVWVIEFRRVA